MAEVQSQTGFSGCNRNDHENQNLTAALALAERGRVFRLADRNNVPRRGSSGHRDATSDPATLRTWWAETPRANIGFAPAESMLVLDGDPRNGGDLDALRGNDPDTAWDETPAQRTPSGGLHLLFAVPRGFAGRCTESTLAPGIDTKSDGGYIAVAPSIRRDGRYEWLPGRSLLERKPATVPTSILARLITSGALVLTETPTQVSTQRAAASSEAEPTAPQKPSAESNVDARHTLPAALCASRLTGFQQTIQKKYPEGIRDGERGRAFQHLSHAARAYGLEEAEILAELEHLVASGKVENPGDRTVCGRGKLAKHARCAAKKPAGRRDNGKPSAVTAKLNTIVGNILATKWTNRRGRATGYGTREVLLALCAIAGEAGSLTVTASQRQLALAAGLERRQTIGGALERLVQDGWIRRGTPGRGRRATVITLLEKPTPSVPIRGGESRPRQVICWDGSRGILAHDAFRRGSLGKTARLVWSALQAGGWRSAAELGRALHLTAETARRNLRGLEAAGLAVRQPTGWQATAKPLEQVAVERGTAGKFERQSEAFEDERLKYLIDLEAWCSARKAQKPRKLALVPGRPGTDAQGSLRSDDRRPGRPSAWGKTGDYQPAPAPVRTPAGTPDLRAEQGR